MSSRSRICSFNRITSAITVQYQNTIFEHIPGTNEHKTAIFFTFTTIFLDVRSRDSSVGIVLGYGLDDRGSRVRFPAGDGNFSLHHRVQNGSGTHPAFYPMRTRGSFPGSKAARGVKLTTHLHLGPRSNNVWSYTSTPQHAFMAWCLVKHRANFTFTLTFLYVSYSSRFLSHCKFRSETKCLIITVLYSLLAQCKF
jgi:hypothetical protein